MSRSGSIQLFALSVLLLHAGVAVAVAEAEPMDLDQPDEEVAEAQPAAASEGRVARSAFTTSIVDREPTDAVTRLSNDRDRVAYFTELLGFEGRTVTHRWEFGGEVVAEVPFEVAGPRWRVHSTKQLDPGRLGTWSVSVVVDDEVLTRENLDYTAVESVPATPAAVPAD